MRIIRGKKIEFKKGDRLVLYSDAVAETHDHKGKMLGESKLIKLIGQNSKSNCRQLIKKIIQSQKEHRHGELHDDLTLSIYSRL